MQVNVRGVNTKVADPLRGYASEKVGHVGRIFDGLMTAEVEFQEERNRRVPDKEVVEVTMTTTAGTTIRARGHAPDGFAAVDLVVDRLEQQVRRLKEKLVGRSHPRESRQNPVHSSELDKDDESDGSPRIVRTKRFDIKPMTAEEAALQMELLGHDFYLFSNSETGESNVVYRRRDGDVGLIEPTR
jgi:putative sigma-54 modulation protein